MNKVSLYLSLLFFSLGASADVLTVTWVAPTQREDLTPLLASEIAGYRLSWTVKGVAQADKNVTGTSYLLDTGTLAGRTCVTLRTVDTDGLESDPSNTACRNAKPKPPTNVAVK